MQSFRVSLYNEYIAEKVKSGAGEKSARFLRNFNAVGAVALGAGAVLIPPLAAPLAAGAALNVAQTVGFEAARRHFAKKK